MTRSEIRAAVTLALIYMFRMLGLFMVLPVLAISAQQFPDYTPAMVGFAIGGYGLMQALLQIPMGSLSDKWGRKPVIAIGLVVFAIGSITAAMADSLAVLIIGRILQGGGAIASAVMALAADVSRDKTRPIVMAIIGIAIGFSFYIAMLLGPIVTTHYGLSSVFWLTAASAIISIPLLYALVPNPTSSISSRDVIPQKEGVLRLMFAPQLWRLNAGVFLLHISITLLFVPFPLLLLESGLTLDEHWRLYLPVLLLSILGLSVLMMIARRASSRYAILIAGIAMASGYGLLVTQDYTFFLLCVAGVVFFSGFNFLEATFPSLVANIAPPGEKGSAMGAYSSFQFCGAFAGSALAGLLLHQTDAQTVFSAGVVCAVLLIATCVPLNSVKPVKRIVLQTETVPENPQQILESILSLAGVEEASWSKSKDALHLKVERQFDTQAVQNMLRPQ